MFNVGDKVTFKDWAGYCQWFNRAYVENRLQADDILEVTWVGPSKYGMLGVKCERAKVGCNIPAEFLQLADTSDMPTQPVETIVDRGSVTIDGQFEERVTDENGEDTIITRRTLDEGR